MKKDIGRKRLERAKIARSKIAKVRKALRDATRENKKKELMEYKSRRRQMPIRESVADRALRRAEALQTSEETFECEVNQETVQRNLDVLKGMEQEFIDKEKRQEEYARKSNDNSGNVGDIDGPGDSCGVPEAPDQEAVSS